MFCRWQPAAFPLSLAAALSLSLSAALITPFSVSTLWFCAQPSPLEVSRPLCVNTPWGIYCSSGAAQRWSCCMLYRYTTLRIYCKTLTNRPGRPESGSLELKRYQSDMIPPLHPLFLLSVGSGGACCWPVWWRSISQMGHHPRRRVR